MIQKEINNNNKKFDTNIVHFQMKQSLDVRIQTLVQKADSINARYYKNKKLDKILTMLIRTQLRKSNKESITNLINL